MFLTHTWRFHAKVCTGSLYAAVHHQNAAKTYLTQAEPKQKSEYLGNRMQAWQVHSYGGIEEVQLSSAARIPIIAKPNQVLVKVEAASVNPLDLRMMNGYGNNMLGVMRAADRLCQEGLSMRPVLEFPITLGRDFAGEVVETGMDVCDVKPGDKVWGVVPPHHQGSHAEYVLMSDSTVCKRPEHLNASDASSIPYAAMTAWSALWLTGGLCFSASHSKKVLVIGASGGVGSVAVQFLKAIGVQVVAICRTDAVPLVESLGADAVVDYTAPESSRLVQLEGPYDIILNASGQCDTPYLNFLKDWQLAAYITITSPLLSNTDQYGLLAGSVKSALDLAMPNLKSTCTKGATVRWGYFTPLKQGLLQITQLTRAGKISPVVDAYFSFANLPDAYRHLSEGHVRGKVVVSMTLPHQQTEQELSKEDGDK